MSEPPPGYNPGNSLIPEYKGDTGMMAMKGGGINGTGEESWQQSLIPAYGGDVKFEAIKGGGGENNNESQAVALAMAADANGLAVETREIPENLPRTNNELDAILASGVAPQPLPLPPPLQPPPLQPPPLQKVNIIMANNTNAATAAAMAMMANNNSKSNGTANSQQPTIKPNSGVSPDISGVPGTSNVSDAVSFKSVDVSGTFNVPMKKVDFFGEEYRIDPGAKIEKENSGNDNYKILELLGLIGNDVDELEKKKILLAIWNDCDGGIRLSQDERCEPMREFLVNLALGLMEGVVPETGIDWSKILPKPPARRSGVSAVASPAVASPAVASPAVASPAVASPAVASPAVASPAVASPAAATLAVASPAAANVVDPTVNDLAVNIATIVALDNFHMESAPISALISEPVSVPVPEVPVDSGVNDLAVNIATFVALDNLHMESATVPATVSATVPSVIPPPVPDDPNNRDEREYTENELNRRLELSERLNNINKLIKIIKIPNIKEEQLIKSLNLLKENVKRLCDIKNNIPICKIKSTRSNKNLLKALERLHEILEKYIIKIQNTEINQNQKEEYNIVKNKTLMAIIKIWNDVNEFIPSENYIIGGLKKSYTHIKPTHRRKTKKSSKY